MKILFFTLALALIGGVFASPSSAEFVELDFSDFEDWNAANPDPADFQAGNGPMVFNDVMEVIGCTVTVEFAGTYDGTSLLSSDGFDNEVDNGQNTWTVTFGSVTDFQIQQTTNHGPDELNTLTVGGGTFDTTSFTVFGDNVASNVSSGPLPPATFAANDTVAIIGPYPYVNGDSDTKGRHPEWTIDGTGTSFTFTQDSTRDNDGNPTSAHRNLFKLFIDDKTHDETNAVVVPEPSSVSLIALGMLGLFSRRRR